MKLKKKLHLILKSILTIKYQSLCDTAKSVQCSMALNTYLINEESLQVNVTQS